MRLQFGCFNCPFEGWVNTDITPHVWVAKIPLLAALLHRLNLVSTERYTEHRRGVFRAVRYMDVTKRFPFPGDTFECAFSSHVLDNLYPAQARFCLTEVFRVLQPGGVLRLVVCDLDRCIEQYDPNNADAFCQSMYVSNQPKDRNKHHWMYNERSLKKLLAEVGFWRITRASFRVGECPDVKVIDNRPDSLFMEARKPISAASAREAGWVSHGVLTK